MKVFIIAAITADGFIGRDSQHTADWTSKEDKQLFVRLTKEAGTMIMGSNTFKTIGRALPGRRTIVYTSRPDNITADHIETTAEPPAALINRLHREGVSSVAICGGASIYHQFLNAGIVNELYLSIEPLLFGQGLTLLGTNLHANLNLLEVRKLNSDTVLLHYKVIN